MIISTCWPLSNPKYKKELVECQHVDQSRIPNTKRNEQQQQHVYRSRTQSRGKNGKNIIKLTTLESKVQEEPIRSQHVDQYRIQNTKRNEMPTC